MRSTQHKGGLGVWIVGPVIGGLLTGLSMMALGRRVSEGGRASESVAAIPAQHSNEGRAADDAELKASIRRLEHQLATLSLSLGAVNAISTRTPSAVGRVPVESTDQEREVARLIDQLERSIARVAQLEAYALSAPNAAEPLQLNLSINMARLRELVALETQEAGAGQAELRLLTMQQLVEQLGRPTNVFHSGSESTMSLTWYIRGELQVNASLGNGYVTYSSIKPLE
ncbi:MAG: hypothetical protein ACI8QS_000481 [Planctomycetota bacterium]|jgi:hypothetical protein